VQPIVLLIVMICTSIGCRIYGISL